jgi:hypothetical protein
MKKITVSRFGGPQERAGRFLFSSQERLLHKYPPCDEVTIVEEWATLEPDRKNSLTYKDRTDHPGFAYRCPSGFESFISFRF